ncbi:MAG: pseudouridine synthase [Desulfobacca sp.]|uniref:pseudouridine synthase n=1 Tax=Desulfobacca sp. TaxID=2067990 RepID=UPI00404A890C
MAAGKQQGEPAVLERLQKFLARAGIASRRRGEELILAGRVQVDGQVVTTLGFCINPAAARVTVDGQAVHLPRQRRTVMLHKPAGYVTTMADPQGRRQVADLLADQPERLFPIGRLDYDATGLLLLTNDGELAHRLMHPRYKVPKTYRVTVAGRFDRVAGAKLSAGVVLDGRLAVAERLRVLQSGPERSVIELTIREGRYHQVKRMLGQVGFAVLRLKRIAYGPLRLGHLAPGAWRDLSPQELAALAQAVGLERGDCN